LSSLFYSGKKKKESRPLPTEGLSYSGIVFVSPSGGEHFPAKFPLTRSQAGISASYEYLYSGI
jgi:hypothetical protein